MTWIGAFWVLHGFSIPHRFTNRYAILLVFLLIMTAFESLYNIHEIRMRYYAVVGLILLAIFSLAIFKGSLSDDLICYLVTMFLGVWLFLLIFLYKRDSIKRGTLIVQLCIVGVVELITNPFFAGADNVSPRTEQVKGLEDLEQIYHNLSVENGERKTAYMINGDLGFSWSQTDIITFSIHSELHKLFRNTGLLIQSDLNYVFQGTTPLTTTLFNVRYVITDWPEYYGGYSESSEDKKITLKRYMIYMKRIT